MVFIICPSVSDMAGLRCDIGGLMIVALLDIFNGKSDRIPRGLQRFVSRKSVTLCSLRLAGIEGRRVWYRDVKLISWTR